VKFDIGAFTKICGQRLNIKAPFIIPTDAHNYKITGILIVLIFL
jgi:hypothetical protein